MQKYKLPELRCSFKESKQDKSYVLSAYNFSKVIFEHLTKAKAKKEASPGINLNPNTTITATTADDKVDQILAKNPGMSAPTFKNVLTANGIKFSESWHAKAAKVFAPYKLKKREADASSANVAVLRAETKEAALKIEIGGHSMLTRFIESNKDGIGPNRFRVILLQEGLGNLANGFWYTANAINNAVSVFEGVKCYANHPSKLDEEIRPERDVREIVGHFEGIQPMVTDDGRTQLIGDLVLLETDHYKWAREICTKTISYSKKFPERDLIALSINASGVVSEVKETSKMLSDGYPSSTIPKLQRALASGVSEVRIVDSINEAVSCDLVTDAGAGGKILDIVT